MDIKLIQDFDFGNELHIVEIKTLKATFLNKIEQIKLLDNHILSLLQTEESENKLNEIVTRDNKSTWILTKIEHDLHKTKIKESQNTPPVQNLTLQDKEVKDIPVKLPKLEISKFNGNVLNWQGFWDQLSSAIHTKNNISDIGKFSYLKLFLCNSALCIVSGLSLSSSNYNH